MKHENDLECWSIVLSDYLIVAIRKNDRVVILYEDDAEEFVIRNLLSVFKENHFLRCKDCNTILTPENIGQLTKDKEGRISGRCIHCLDREIIRLIRRAHKPILVQSTSSKR